MEKQLEITRQLQAAQLALKTKLLAALRASSEGPE